jgi:hypothetical protein
MSHLVVDDWERDLRLLQSAAVIVRRDRRGDLSWAKRTLNRNPGARIAAFERDYGHVTVAFRHREALTVASDTSPVDPALIASAVYATDLLGELPARGSLAIPLRVGRRRLRLTSVG